MNHSSVSVVNSSSQEAIRAKGFHPTGTFIEFKKQDIEQSIPNRFEQQVAKYPHRLAVKTISHQLTYNELNKAANRVARAILAQRGEGEEPIVLLLESDAPMIAAILGVLKAGKICVPLDPSFPHARLAYILEDSQTGLIVTTNKNHRLVKELGKDEIVLGTIDKLDAGFSHENIGLPILPDALVYLFYTSGSTGQPKGVVHNHRNILHLIMRHTNSLHICADDRLLLLSPYSLAGITDIFRALLNGTALFPFDLKAEGIANLANWLIQEEITICHPVPTVFRYFVDTLSGKEEFPKLRVIHLGGEPVFHRDVKLYKKHFSTDCILLNNLGATELSSYRQYFMNKETVVVRAGLRQ